MSIISVTLKVKRSLLLPALLFTFAMSSLACEICGCGNNNFQIGILPSFSKGFIGLRYTGSIYHSKMHNNASEYSNDYYRSMELWGGYNFKRIQVIGFVPYFHARKVSDDGTTVSNGLGDALVILNYRLWTTVSLLKNETTTLRNELYFGGGIKLPTGVNRVDAGSADFNIGDFNSQAGTGSIDYLVNLTHNIQWNNQGIVTNIAYRINSKNSQDYRFGNRSYINGSYFYTFNAASLKIKPSAGINFQHNALNSYKGADVEESNGYNFNSTFGINVLKNKLGLNAMVFVPIAQNAYDGQTKLQSRLVMGLTYSF